MLLTDYRYLSLAVGGDAEVEKMAKYLACLLSTIAASLVLHLWFSLSDAKMVAGERLVVRKA